MKEKDDETDDDEEEDDEVYVHLLSGEEKTF